VDPSLIYVSMIPESPFPLELVILGAVPRRKLGISTLEALLGIAQTVQGVCVQ
jgi:hypothetical protein